MSENYFNLRELTGLDELRKKTNGDPEITIALLDGPVDVSIPAFENANLEVLIPPFGDPVVGSGPMSAHGTHIASVLFAAHDDGPVAGLAPACKGLVIPIYYDAQQEPTPQRDLAQAIAMALDAGAQVINISGGQLTRSGEADPILVKVVQNCEQRGVLIVAATGNEGCACLNVPAVLDPVLAVGAMDRHGRPLPFSNWGTEYRRNGILAHGEHIVGFVPGGRVVAKTGTSFATPIVSGIAALLLSWQRKLGRAPDPFAVKHALIQGAAKCDVRAQDDCELFLAGVLDLPETMARLLQASPGAGKPGGSMVSLVARGRGGGRPGGILAAEPRATGPREKVYLTGRLDYDFGSQVTRDRFFSTLPRVDAQGRPAAPGTAPTFAPNPHDPRQMVHFLGGVPAAGDYPGFRARRAEAAELVWLLSPAHQPAYVIRPREPFVEEGYRKLVDFLRGQLLGATHPDCLQRLALPGRLPGEEETLLSGERLPVATCPMHEVRQWQLNQDLPTTTVGVPWSASIDRAAVLLDNPGRGDQLRAINFALIQAFLEPRIRCHILEGQGVLDQVTAAVFQCREFSICWDVRLFFIQRANILRPKKVFRFRVDVAKTTPILGGIRDWSEVVSRPFQDHPVHQRLRAMRRGRHA